MAKIVIDGRELRTSSGRYVERLIKYLQQIDTQNHYQVLIKPGDIETWQGTKNFEAISCPHKEFSLAEQRALLDQITALNPDLVHFTFPQQPIRYKGKTVTTIHDLTTLRWSNPDKNVLVFKAKQQIYKYVIKQSVAKASAVITPTKYVKTDLVNFSHVPEAKITVTYEAADKISDKAVPVLELEGQDYIMYVGRPMPHKNLNRLIEAFSQLKRSLPELNLVLAGNLDNNYRRIEQHVKDNAIPDVLFTGFVSEGQLRWLYEHCLVYAYPSLSEGFGLPGLEAMVHNAPVASSNATCLPEVYGPAAVYFNPNDTSDVSKVLKEIITKETVRQELIKAGRQQAKKYSWAKMAEQTLNIYERVLKS